MPPSSELAKPRALCPSPKIGSILTCADPVRQNSKRLAVSATCRSNASSRVMPPEACVPSNACAGLPPEGAICNVPLWSAMQIVILSCSNNASVWQAALHTKGGSMWALASTTDANTPRDATTPASRPYHTAWRAAGDAGAEV
eukprot:CAMPEP_0115184226 /NCGR_PEP_ID=MMETSP0270-20121206/8854_1 /TAXON_ID=71861 /ORGANISM="Scrippsiella trochoidea, Strain CCMP3099" /LENGTH=142 /DNA_ID=CAMNT_0002597307 /DNA_START=309 /DNA_END=737 /DNA_ORIENTATION=+